MQVQLKFVFAVSVILPEQVKPQQRIIGFVKTAETNSRLDETENMDKSNGYMPKILGVSPTTRT